MTETQQRIETSFRHLYQSAKSDPDWYELVILHAIDRLKDQRQHAKPEEVEREYNYRVQEFENYYAKKV